MIRCSSFVVCVEQAIILLCRGKSSATQIAMILGWMLLRFGMMKGLFKHDGVSWRAFSAIRVKPYFLPWRGRKLTVTVRKYLQLCENADEHKAIRRGWKRGDEMGQTDLNLTLHITCERVDLVGRREDE